MDGSKPTWLTVGGCPRSGTTALGDALNRHLEISLFHEYDQAHLFSTLNALFREEKRLGAYSETEQFELIPRKDRHEVAILKSMFEIVAGKQAKVLGTKFPGVHLWPQPRIPDGVDWKTIHITRDPFAVILSYAHKMLREGYGDHHVILDTAIAHWVSAWNHAVAKRFDDDFCHIFYEDIGDPKLVERVTSFLNLSTPVDFSSLASRNESPETCLAKLESLGFSGCREKVLSVVSTDWNRKYVYMYEMGCYLGFPLRANERIELSTVHGANAWKYPIEGFYPVEAQGRWINGSEASVLFSPTFESRRMLLCLDVAWVCEPGGEVPLVDIEINGERIATAGFTNGQVPGVPHRYMWAIDSKTIKANTTNKLVFRPLNPRNPKKLGLSQDDRELSIMINSIQIEEIN